MTDNPKGATPAEPLKPCPFCGTTPNRVAEDSYGSLWTCCEGCGVTTSEVGISTREEAVARWNRRATPAEPEFTDTARAALLWVLWHHQGGSSKVGQPLRFALGMGAHDRLSEDQVEEARRWGELHATPAAAAEIVPLTERQFAEWLNDRRMYDVSSVFHDIVAHYRAAIAIQAAPAPKDLGVSPSGPGSSLQPPSSASAAIPDASLPASERE